MKIAYDKLFLYFTSYWIMEPLFTEDARKNFIVGITEIILQIFEIDDEGKRETIMGDLKSLDDSSLLKKKDDIDDYFGQAAEINKSYFYRLLHMEHLFLENEERRNIDTSLSIIIW